MEKQKGIDSEIFQHLMIAHACTPEFQATASCIEYELKNNV